MRRPYIFIILIICIATLFWIGLRTINSEKKVEVMSAQAEEFADEMSSEEYDRIKQMYVAILQDEDPRVALAALREEIKTNSTLSRSCHGLVHDLGHEGYKKYKDFGQAMQYQDEVCNSGYLHGIIESVFVESKDLFASMNSICTPYKIGSFVSWECYHGVGHGIMYYTKNNLPESLALCSKYESNFARTNCNNGVFMENFNADGKLHISKFLKSDDLFYPCSDQKRENKSICYLYAPTHFLNTYKNQYTQALEWCKKAEWFYKDDCAVGVGSQAIKENINNPKFVETVCTNSSKFREPCIDGMVGLYINHYGSIEPAIALCKEMQKENMSICEGVVARSASMFTSPSNFN